MSEGSLKHHTKKGLVWNVISNIASQGIRFVFGIILARLLDPSSYGILGILNVFICLVSIFIDCGFSNALVCKSNRSQTDFSTEFFFNILIGILGYFLLFIISPYVALIYDMQILKPTLRVLALGVVINSLCVVQKAQFAIKLDFKTPAKITVFTQFLSGIFGIFLAFKGFGIWALVIQQTSGCLLNAVLLWALARWKPTMEFSIESLRFLWGYGSKVLGASLMQQIYDNIYPLLIGKFFSPSTLGLYTRANSFAYLPSGNIGEILGKVTFPIMTKISDEKERLSIVYRRMLKSTALIVFPLMFGMAATADLIVEVILNDKWYACIPLLRILCLALIWQPISTIQINLLLAIKRTDVVFKSELYRRLCGILTILISLPFGIHGICYSLIAFNLVTFFINSFYISRVLSLHFLKQVCDLLPILLQSLLMGLIVFSMTFISINPVILLVASVFLGFIFYMAISYFWNKDVLYDTLNMIKRVE